MSKRSASYFLKVLSVLVAPLVLVGLTASSGSAATATTPTFFGAKLTTQSQPSNAENGQSCDENGGIPHGSTCTWVAITAFENGSHFTAPRTGTVKHVKLVSCVRRKIPAPAGQGQPECPHRPRSWPMVPRSATPARVRAGARAATTTSSRASGSSLHVAKGDYIAIKARSTGTLSCSGGDGFLLYAPPLRVGGPLRKSHSGASCDLLVQLSYR